MYSHLAAEGRSEVSAAAVGLDLSSKRPLPKRVADVRAAIQDCNGKASLKHLVGGGGGGGGGEGEGEGEGGGAAAALADFGLRGPALENPLVEEVYASSTYACRRTRTQPARVRVRMLLSTA